MPCTPRLCVALAFLALLLCLSRASPTAQKKQDPATSPVLFDHDWRTDQTHYGTDADAVDRRFYTPARAHKRGGTEFCEEGCNLNVAFEFIDFANSNVVRLCRGNFTGYIFGASAQSLCAPSWHVCSPATNVNDYETFRSINVDTAYSEVEGCYAFDAAHDCSTCRPCTGNIHEDDMAGVGWGCVLNDDDVNCRNDPLGPDCRYPRDTESACFADGRIDVCCTGYLDSNACQWRDIITGVACCADNVQDPCFNTSCPRDCCDRGVCDISTGQCACEIGFSGEDCCTECEAIQDCYDCIAEPSCAYCLDSDSCTTLALPGCFSPTRDNSTCPVIVGDGTSFDEATAIGAIVGGVVAGLLCLLLSGIVLGFLMYRRFSSEKFAPMWTDFAHSSPLYSPSKTESFSALYQES